MTAALTSWKTIGPGLIEHARQSGRPLPAELTDPDHPPTPEQIVDFVRDIAATHFRPRPFRGAGSGKAQVR